MLTENLDSKSNLQNANRPALTYKRNVLYQSKAFEVVSIEWTKESHSPPHNHGWSQCLVSIEAGSFENILDLGSKKEIQVLEAGQMLTTPLGAQHEMKCTSDTGRSFHIYTPKIIEAVDSGHFKIAPFDELKKELQLSEPTNIDKLQKILDLIQTHSISTRSPYFMNQLFSGVSPQMLMAEDLISKTKTTMATYEASPALSTVETEVIESLGALIGWKSGQRDGINVPGGSAANFMALHCARHKKFPDFKKTGMSGVRCKIFVSTEAHYSYKKACVALGFGTDSLIHVPADADGRLLAHELDILISESIAQGFTPLMVGATIGTTVMGAFDPLDQLAVVCEKHDLWLHADGAWGGPALFSKKSRHLVQGIELADSVAFDAHKLFGAGLTCSFFLTSHAGLLQDANDVSGGDYLFHSDDPSKDRGKFSWQCGRRADAVSFWTLWKNLGTAGLGHFVDQLGQIRDETLTWIQQNPRLQLVANPSYLNICVRVKPQQTDQDAADWSRVVRETLKDQNLAMVNYSADSNGTFLRLILANPYLKTEHVTQILKWALEV